MPKLEKATIPIEASDGWGAGVIIVRAIPGGRVCLCLSAENDGDVELSLNQEELSLLRVALEFADPASHMKK